MRRCGRLNASFLIDGIISSFFYHSPCPNSVIIFGWRSSIPRTEAIGTLYYIPIMYLMRLAISHAFGSFLFPPTAPTLPLHSPSYLSAAAAASTAALALARSNTFFSHHLLATHFPVLLTILLNRSRIRRVGMYCAAVLCLFWIYFWNIEACVEISNTCFHHNKLFYGV